MQSMADHNYPNELESPEAFPHPQDLSDMDGHHHRDYWNNAFHISLQFGEYLRSGARKPTGVTPHTF